MKKFSCYYLKENGNGQTDPKSPFFNIEAASAEEAAHIFAEQYPSDHHPQILVKWGSADRKILSNRERSKRLRLEKEAEERQRLESLQKLHSSVESMGGNLAGLSYIELSALVENLKDFPVMRDKIGPAECAVREELYKVAFFDRNLQAELQVELLRDLKSAFTDLQSGKSGGGAGKSNLARNVGMMGGLAALQKLNQIEENTADVSEGFEFG